jgi:hypothetical protein
VHYYRQRCQWQCCIPHMSPPHCQMRQSYQAFSGHLGKGRIHIFWSTLSTALRQVCSMRSSGLAEDATYTQILAEIQTCTGQLLNTTFPCRLEEG